MLFLSWEKFLRLSTFCASGIGDSSEIFTGGASPHLFLPEKRSRAREVEKKKSLKAHPSNFLMEFCPISQPEIKPWPLTRLLTEQFGPRGSTRATIPHQDPLDCPGKEEFFRQYLKSKGLQQQSWCWAPCPRKFSVFLLLSTISTHFCGPGWRNRRSNELGAVKK